MTRMILVALMTVFLAPAAGATDGVLEINQACAFHTGCFSGDDPDWPVQITTSGSYLLTSNLVVPDVNTTAINVAAPGVSIDLGGFEIVTQACLGAAVNCAANGIGDGIKGFPGDYRGTAVRNGSIAGMGNYGVRLGDQAEVTDLRVRWNSETGIWVASGASVSDSTAYENEFYGISTGAGATVSGSTAYGNAGIGIKTSFASTISGNVSYENGQTGIHGVGGSTISGNTVYGNGGDGIKANLDSMISGNTVRTNGNYGIYVDLTACGYTGNVISDNTKGDVFGPGKEFGTNLCNGNTTCQ